jgi:hypothetical protein
MKRRIVERERAGKIGFGSGFNFTKDLRQGASLDNLNKIESKGNQYFIFLVT